MSAAELTINVTEFKAKSLNLLDRLSRGEIGKITVTKRGQPLAVVSPPARPPVRFEDIYGSMKDRTFIPEGVDLTEPTIHPEWEEEWLADWDKQLRSAP